MILSIHRSLKDSFRRPSDRTLDRPFLPKDMVMWKGAHSPKDICSSFRLTGHDQKCDVFLGTFEKWHKLLIVKSEISFLQGQLWESIPGLRDINCLLQSFRLLQSWAWRDLKGIRLHCPHARLAWAASGLILLFHDCPAQSCCTLTPHHPRTQLLLWR